MKLLNAIKILGLLILVSSCSDNHEYVDLGLLSGTLWATYNVGASKLTEYGDLFAWGETSTKETFTYKTYKFYKEKDGKNVISKYNSKSFFGTIDNKTVLAPQDDAASVLWGGSWRMPTLEEMKELVSCCNWEWTDDYEGSGVAGQIGKSMKNGNTIFLPCKGSGHYWSSSLNSGNTNNAYYLSFGSGGIDPQGYMNRYNGSSVRAVCPYKK